MNDDDNEIDPVERALEAMLFAADAPLSVDQIARYFEGEANIRGALAALQSRYQGRGIELVQRGGRWHFQTAADLSYLLRRETEQLRKLSRAATETLAIIAYHEPVSRAEIEAIRGVQVSKGTLDVLMEEEWIKPAGRREVPGRPLIYATTPEFLTHFGLESRRDLPGIEDLRAAGLLDPVDLAMEQMGFGEDDEADESDDEYAGEIDEDADSLESER